MTSMTTDPTLRVLSLGAGVQSTTLALMSVEGVLPRLDAAIFADTGWEPTAVYDHLADLESVLTAAGVEVYRVSNGNLRDDVLGTGGRSFDALPVFTRNLDGSDGMGRRQCTHEYKLKPIYRKVRELLGAEAPAFRSVKRGRWAEKWIGFSHDEVWRVNDKTTNRLYLRGRYPLQELGMDRRACERWLDARGWSTVKSACIGCPFHGNRQWRELRDQRPDEWADAVAFDAAIRKGSDGTFNGEAFLHASRVPLPLAPIDKVTRKEWKDRQSDIFDVLEESDPVGCSPYGCHPSIPA